MVSSTVVALETGALTFQLLDDDGDPLPGSWSYEWSGRDPLELAIYAITELSGRPWKWSSRRLGRALLSPDRCRALATRVGKLLKKETRGQTAAVVARIIAHECLRPGQRAPEVEAIEAILAGEHEPDWDAGPHESTPAMLRALREALRDAVENEVGLQITWGDEDE
jgi:hypothetical protein